jgi:nucleotide-binding universal stress UspA family protein
MHEGATITVGYDGSSCAQRAVEWAAAEAAGGRARVRVVACFDVPLIAEPWYVQPRVDVADVGADAHRRVEGIITRVAASHPGVAFEPSVEMGNAADRLVAAASGSALLVVGSRGYGPLDTWRLGSVAHAVARRAPCPVVVVPDVGPRPTQHRVVVGVDGSPPAMAALRWACDEADDRDAELLVVHVWDYPYATAATPSPVRDLMEVDAALVLDEAVRTARERRRGPVEELLAVGAAAPELVEHARDADLLVIGSRGRNRLSSLLFGSVSREVTGQTPCPVVIVRDTEVAR